MTPNNIEKPETESELSAARCAVAAGSVLLRTTCGRTLWAGFFGINEDGDQPECECEIEVECEQDQIKIDRHGVPRPCFAVECPSCKGMIEWPQEWEIVKPNTGSQTQPPTTKQLRP